MEETQKKSMHNSNIAIVEQTYPECQHSYLLSPFCKDPTSAKQHLQYKTYVGLKLRITISIIMNLKGIYKHPFKESPG